MNRRAVFFDRDGIVNVRIVGDYIKKPEEFIFKEDFLDLFITLKLKNLLKILITNQQGIGKGFMSESDLSRVHSFMQRNLKLITRSEFDDIYFCPDLAETNSFRRKPNPGMLFEAIEKYKIDKRNSWMIGDSQSDVIAGKRAGLNTILIGSYINNEIPEADYIFQDLSNVKEFLLKEL